MKPQISLVAIAASVVLLASCDMDSTMITTIRPDGSIKRVIELDADSAMLCRADGNGKIPIEGGNGWTCLAISPSGEVRTLQLPLNASSYQEAKRRLDKDRMLRIRLERIFSSVKQLNDSCRFATSYPLHKSSPESELDKSFRWFYTYYTYRESYPHYPFQPSVPYQRFMTPTEAAYWFTGSPNLMAGLSGLAAYQKMDDLRRKYLQWIDNCIFEDAYQALVKAYSPIKEGDIRPEALRKDKDAIRKIFMEQDSSSKDLQKVLKAYYRSSSFDYLWADKGAMAIFGETYGSEPQEQVAGVNIVYKLLMPGEVRSTNAPIVAGDTLRWNVTGHHLLYGPMSIVATSRQTNVWAFVLTGLVIVALLALAILSALKGRKQRL